MPLPGAEHVLQTHREDDVALDAAMTGDHYRQGILHAGDHSHPVREPDVDRHRRVERGGLDQARLSRAGVDMDCPTPGSLGGWRYREGLQLVGDRPPDAASPGRLEAPRP